MSAHAYYNEIDPYAAQWLRNLIKAGHIAPGYVDERSIVDVKPEDLTEFTQCHFFAGIGVWSLALRNAGWPDDKPVWTGSCPCQPFSSAGNQRGTADERHLAPIWLNLIKERKPANIFGEQVAAAIGKHWLDDLFNELECQKYSCGAAVLPACGVGAPHIRQRLWFGASRMADANSRSLDRCGDVRAQRGSESSIRHFIGGMADTSSVNDNQRCVSANVIGWSNNAEQAGVGGCANRNRGPSNPTNGFWQDADWLLCRDGKWRPVEPGTFPLAHGITNRVGRLRAYGNAINAEAATVFIAAYMSAVDSVVRK